MGEQVSRYLRTSDHVYTDGVDRLRLVYATRTGTVACLPEEVADRLATGDVTGTDRELLDELRSIKAVVPDDEAELRAVLDLQREAVKDIRRRRYVLLPTTYCNMGCSYCGQEH